VRLNAQAQAPDLMGAWVSLSSSGDHIAAPDHVSHAKNCVGFLRSLVLLDFTNKLEGRLMMMIHARSGGNRYNVSGLMSAVLDSVSI
jgi:hypothetical protein